MPNNDLISRAALVEDLSYCAPELFFDTDFLLCKIMKQPIIDAAPVVHGRWVVDEDPHDGDVRCSRCSVCIDALHERHWPTLKVLGYTLSSFYPYCPHCGAKMDGDKDDG